MQVGRQRGSQLCGGSRGAAGWLRWPWGQGWQGFGGQRWTLGLCRAEDSSMGPGSEHGGGLRDPQAGNGGWGLDLLGRCAACWHGGGRAGTTQGDPG